MVGEVEKGQPGKRGLLLLQLANPARRQTVEWGRPGFR